MWSGKQASKQQNWNCFPWARLASGHRNTVEIPFWGCQRFSMNMESKKSGRNNRNILRHNFTLNEDESPLIEGRWYKSSTTCKTKKERNGEETKAASDYESTARENKSEQKTRQSVLKKMHLHMAEPYQNLLRLIIQMQKLGYSLLALLPQQLLFSSPVGTQLLGQNKCTVCWWIWRESFQSVQIRSGDIDVTTVPSEQLIRVTEGDRPALMKLW